MTTVILAGGASRRMGRDKAMLPFRGTTLLQYLIDQYATIGRVIVSLDRGDRFCVKNAEIVPDRFPGMGPMNGLVSGFSVLTDDHLFLTATDIPFGDPSLALRLESMLGDHDICLINHGVKYETLFGVYARTCLPSVERSLEIGHNSIKKLFGTYRIRMVEPCELPGYDLDRILMNVNTEEDYKKIFQNF